MSPGICQKLRATGTYDGKQGFTYFEGIAKESVGSQGICLHVLRVPPGGRAKAHLHEAHETAIYALEGTAKMHWGDRLEHLMEIEAGDMVYIPAGVPHLPFNDGKVEAVAVIARTDPNEQESVTLLPDLDALAP
ncbi:MAG: cupin domain-containing protein [Pseudomonadota bacterium]